MDAGLTGSISRIKIHNPRAVSWLCLKVLQPPAGPRAHLGAGGFSLGLKKLKYGYRCNQGTQLTQRSHLY